VLTQLTVPGEARPLKIAPEAIYTSSFRKFAWTGNIFFRVKSLKSSHWSVNQFTCSHIVTVVANASVRMETWVGARVHPWMLSKIHARLHLVNWANNKINLFDLNHHHLVAPARRRMSRLLPAPSLTLMFVVFVTGLFSWSFSFNIFTPRPIFIIYQLTASGRWEVSMFYKAFTISKVLLCKAEQFHAEFQTCFKLTIPLVL